MSQTMEEIPPQVPLQQQTKPKAIRILSIDGGGIRGIAVARLLQGIEEHTQKKIHELFDVIVGTSTGGLLSVMMSVEVPPISTEACEGICEEEKEQQQRRQRQVAMRNDLNVEAGQILTAEQAVNLYRKKATKIFNEQHGLWHKLTDWIPGISHINHLGIVRSRYEKAAGLQEVVQDLFIDNGFAHARTCVGVVVTERGFGASMLLNSTNAKADGTHNYHNKLSLTQLIRATSAAPTFFSPVHIHNPHFPKNKNKKYTDEEFKALQDHAKNNPSCVKWASHTLEYKLCQRKVLFFEDGGVTCNNPSIKAFKYAKELLKLNGENHHEYQFQLYSIGTGSTEHKQVDPAEKIIQELECSGKPESGVVDAFKRLLAADPFGIAGITHKNHLKMLHKLKVHGAKDKKDYHHQYFRLQFKVTETALGELDRCDKAHLDYLIDAAEECMGLKEGVSGSEDWPEILRALDREVERPKNLISSMPKTCAFATQ